MAAAVAVAGALASPAGAKTRKPAKKQTGPPCSTLVTASRLNAQAGTTFGHVKEYKDKRWYYPYNVNEPTPGSECLYQWPNTAVPPDFLGIYGTNVGGGGYTSGANVVVGYGLSQKAFATGRAAANQYGTGEPAVFGPGSVRSLKLGPGIHAYAESGYGGTGPTYNSIGVVALSPHHNYVAVEAWDATEAQLISLVKTVIGHRAGAGAF